MEHVLQVEIDERVTRLSEQFFPELCESNGDARAEFYFGDGIRWMQEAPAGSVDVIIVDSTDPIGPAKGLFGNSRPLRRSGESRGGRLLHPPDIVGILRHHDDPGRGRRLRRLAEIFLRG